MISSWSFEDFTPTNILLETRRYYIYEKHVLTFTLAFLIPLTARHFLVRHRVPTTHGSRFHGREVSGVSSLTDQIVLASIKTTITQTKLRFFRSIVGSGITSCIIS